MRRNSHDPHRHPIFIYTARLTATMVVSYRPAGKQQLQLAATIGWRQAPGFGTAFRRAGIPPLVMSFNHGLMNSHSAALLLPGLGPDLARLFDPPPYTQGPRRPSQGYLPARPGEGWE